VLAGLLATDDVAAAPFLIRAMTSPVWLSQLQSGLAVAAQEFENQLWLGMIALEAGDTRAARRALDDALAAVPPGYRFGGQEVAELYRALSERYGGK
jgi:Tfp pilus assembly protein PilF